MAELRPLVPDDAQAVVDLQRRSFGDLDRRMHLPVAPPPKDPAPGLRRVEHLAETDPDGAWLAVDDDGNAVGAALALVREGIWGLSLLVVDPDHQSAGMGRALLDASLRTAEGTRGGIILASEDPRALRAYHRAGFALRPVMDASGPVRVRPEPCAAVREARWPEDLPLMEAVSRAVRGASHAVDLAVYAGHFGTRMFVHDDGGYAVGREHDLVLLAADDDRVARALLRTILAGAPGEYDVPFLDAQQEWAFDEVLAAGLRLRPSGAVCVRGEVGPMRPYIPSGAYL